MTTLLLLGMTAQAQPDLHIEQLTPGCTGTGGDPTVVVSVHNAGTTAAGEFFVDLFRGLSSPPAMGTTSEMFQRVTSLGAGARRTVTFTFTQADQGWSGWFDALVDTDGFVAESNESNNHADEFLTLLDCSFN